MRQQQRIVQCRHAQPHYRGPFLLADAASTWGAAARTTMRHANFQQKPSFEYQQLLAVQTRGSKTGYLHAGHFIGCAVNTLCSDGNLDSFYQLMFIEIARWKKIVSLSHTESLSQSQGVCRNPSCTHSWHNRVIHLFSAETHGRKGKGEDELKR